MAVTINPLTPGFAGEGLGVDITKSLSREEVAAIDQGMNRYGVLVFHGQNVTDEQQIAFSRNFR
jgi:alpha-ketoglutarate-dependent 2,4-dichlorophenoxyacetate dioxygenase